MLSSIGYRAGMRHEEVIQGDKDTTRGFSLSEPNSEPRFEMESSVAIFP